MADLRIAYTVHLTADEYRSLSWLEDHGYAADMIREATEDTENEIDGSHTLGFTEPAAWNVHDNAYPEDLRLPNEDRLDDAFGACAGPVLLRKMFEFLDGII
jgi:hypothetical protein